MYGTFKMKHDKLQHILLGIVAYLIWYVLPHLNGNIKCAIVILLTVEFVQIEGRLQRLKDLPRELVRKDMWLDLLAGSVGVLAMYLIMRL